MKPTAARLARLEAYIEQSAAEYRTGGATEEQVAELVAALRCEDQPWMPYEVAQPIIASVNMGTKVDRDEFFAANRTSVTATKSERARLVSRYLGIDYAVACQHVARVDSASAQPDSLPQTPDQCALYRHYDADGVLLYIGIANDPELRTQQHSETSPWFKFSEYMEIEWCDTRRDALTAEREAIADEEPIFNKANNLAARDAAVAYLLKRAS